jgi:hypothetical protein
MLIHNFVVLVCGSRTVRFRDGATFVVGLAKAHPNISRVTTSSIYYVVQLGVFIGSVIGLFGLFGSVCSVNFFFWVKPKTEPNRIQI